MTGDGAADDAARRERVTAASEARRAVAAGFLEAGSATFLMLIAVRWYGAGDAAKGIVSAAGGVGFLLAPSGVRAAERFGLTSSGGAAWCAAVTAAAFLTAALFPTLYVFVTCSVVGVAAWNLGVPLLTRMYQENYRPATRGRTFARSVSIRIITSALFSEAAGRVLEADIAAQRYVILSLSASASAAAYFLWRVPTSRLRRPVERGWFRGFAYLRSDRLFRTTLVCWMLMGFGNLMMFPLRVEYLANPRFGLSLSVSDVALYVGVIPAAARLAVIPVWGRLFDKMNFFALRLTLNLGFVFAIASFFTGGGTWGLVLGAVLFGASNAGGEIAWNLWVTKFAPPEKTADYMAVHTFLTGVRGITAPIVAFSGLSYVSIGTLAWGAVGLILLGCVPLLAEWRK